MAANVLPLEPCVILTAEGKLVWRHLLRAPVKCRRAMTRAFERASCDSLAVDPPRTEGGPFYWKSGPKDFPWDPYEWRAETGIAFPMDLGEVASACERCGYCPSQEIIDAGFTTDAARMVLRNFLFHGRQLGEEQTHSGSGGDGPAAPDLVQWAGGTKATLAVVFTDIVSSTALGNKLGNCAMDELRRAHFAQAGQLVSRFGGRVVKTNGDSVMAAFHAATDALDFAVAVNAEPGDLRIAVRAGLHVGPVTVEEADVNGGTVNRAARVVHEAAGAEVWLSSEAKIHVDQERAPQHASLQWLPHRGVKLKGFPGKHTLYSLAGR